jgi:hypothetical protein
MDLSVFVAATNMLLIVRGYLRLIGGILALALAAAWAS